MVQNTINNKIIFKSINYPKSYQTQAAHATDVLNNTHKILVIVENNTCDQGLTFIKYFKKKGGMVCDQDSIHDRFCLVFTSWISFKTLLMPNISFENPGHYSVKLAPCPSVQ